MAERDGRRGGPVKAPTKDLTSTYVAESGRAGGGESWTVKYADPRRRFETGETLIPNFHGTDQLAGFKSNAATRAMSYTPPP